MTSILKKLLRILLFTVLNIGLIVAAFWFYVQFSYPLESRLLYDSGLETFAFVLGPVIVVLGMALSRKFRLVAPGSVAIGFSLLLFLIYFLNAHYGKKGEYLSYRLVSAEWSKAGCEMSVDFSNFRINKDIEVPQEKCLNVDSVLVRIDRGFFGFRLITTDLRIVEKTNCEIPLLDTTENPEDYYFNMAGVLAHNRCYEQAITAYSQCLEINQHHGDAHYHRGLMYLAREDYERAKEDFVITAAIELASMEEHQFEELRFLRLDSLSHVILKEVEDKNYENLQESVGLLSRARNLEIYTYRILYCMNKIKERKQGLSYSLHR